MVEVGETLGGRAFDGVRAMADLARRCQLIAARDGPAVQAIRELRQFVRMAGAALHGLQLFGMRKLLDCGQIGMARSAFQFGMRRSPQSGRIESGRHSGFAPARTPARIVAVEAILRAGQRLGACAASVVASKAAATQASALASRGFTLAPFGILFKIRSHLNIL